MENAKHAKKGIILIMENVLHQHSKKLSALIELIDNSLIKILRQCSFISINVVT